MWEGSSPEAKAKNAGKGGGIARYVINSITDIEGFISMYEITQGKFGDLALGDFIQINDGVYNTSWSIAEFDYHCDAADDFDRDYVNKFHNIALVPRLGPIDDEYYYMYGTGSTYACFEAYKGSKINQETLPTVITALKTVLGDHLKPFYQYVSSANDTITNTIREYEWLKKEAFLMSEYQCFGDNGLYSIETVQKYEHKFPLMDLIDFGTGEFFWLRSMGPVTGCSFSSFCHSERTTPYFKTIQPASSLCPFIVLG